MPPIKNFWYAGVLNVVVIVLAIYFGFPQTAIAIVQTLVLADTLWVLWLYTRATFTLATTAEEQMKLVKAQFIDEKVGELIKAKPIVFTDCGQDGETRISNVGDAFATNVWYVAEEGQDPMPLGSLREGHSRVVPINVADRHVLISEQRQMPPGVARKFTPTLNAWCGQAFAHGFIHRTKGTLEHRGSVKDYLVKSPDLVQKLLAYDPLTHDPDKS